LKVGEAPVRSKKGGGAKRRENGWTPINEVNDINEVNAECFYVNGKRLLTNINVKKLNSLKQCLTATRSTSHN